MYICICKFIVPYMYMVMPMYPNTKNAFRSKINAPMLCLLHAYGYAHVSIYHKSFKNQ